MFKLTVEEFKEEVKAEMYGYEEISEEAMNKWFATFEAFVAAKKKSNLITYEGRTVTITLKDESDLFMMVDRYLAAIVNDDLDNYYTEWTL